MRNSKTLLCLCLFAFFGFSAFAAEKQTTVFIHNPFQMEWTGPVNINLQNAALALPDTADVTVSDNTGKALLSQTDDLNFDGKADETVVMITLPPGESKILKLVVTDKQSAPHPFAEPLDGFGLKTDYFELLIGPDGLVNSLSLKQDGKFSKIVNSSNLHVWKVDNTGWEQKSGKLKMKRKIGSLRAVYDINGEMNRIDTEGEMLLHRLMKVYPNSRIDNTVEVFYKSGPPFYTGNNEGGIRSHIECDANRLYRTLRWDFDNKLKIADMKKAWSHMRRVPAGIIGGFMDPAEGVGIISMPGRQDSSLRLWDNRTTYIPGTPAKQMLIVNGLGWWGQTVKSGDCFRSGWQTYSFQKQEQAEQTAKIMIEAPLTFYSAKELSRTISEIYGIRYCSTILKYFENAELEKAYQKVQAAQEMFVENPAGNLDEYLQAAKDIDALLWSQMDKKYTEFMAGHNADNQQATAPVAISAGKYMVYRKLQGPGRITSDWSKLSDFKARALNHLIQARRHQQKIIEENIGKLMPVSPGSMQIGFFGGDPSPKGEDIWTQVSSLIGLNHFHPAYYTQTLKVFRKGFIAPDWTEYLNLHKKYGNKYLICIQTERKSKHRKLDDTEFKDWLARTHDGKILTGWFGKTISAVDPELYGSEPEWMKQVKVQIQAYINSYVKMCRENNLSTDKIIIGFAVENEPVFVYNYNPHVMKAYRNWLKIKFADIATFNQKMKTSFESFSKVYPPSVEKRFISPAEWICFNEFRLDNQAGYIKWQADIIKEIDPEIIVITKPNCSYGTSATIARGNDSWKMGWSQRGKTGLNFYCRKSENDFALRYSTHVDVMRSGGNGQLLWQSELGISPFEGLPENSLIHPQRSREMIYTMALHGVEIPFLYNLSSARRNPSSYLRGDFFPTDSMLALAERQKEFDLLGGLNNFKPKRKIALYYSRLSAIMGNPDPKVETELIHNFFRHMNYQVDYIDLEQVLKGDLKKYNMLYIQHSLYIDRKLPELLRDFVRNGGVLVMEGPGGCYDNFANEYKVAPANLADLFGASQIKTGNNAELSFDDDKLKIKAGKLAFDLNKTDYCLKSSTVKSLIVNPDNGRPLATHNNYGNGHAILLAFSVGENYRKAVEKASTLAGEDKGFFDADAGISHSSKKIYQEPTQLPQLGRWFENCFNSVGICPAISRAEKDIEAAIFLDKSGRECVILINHRNMKLSPRLTMNNVKVDEPIYDIFTMDKFIPREVEGKSVMRMDMQPYQVRILVPGQH